MWREGDIFRSLTVKTEALDLGREVIDTSDEHPVAGDGELLNAPVRLGDDIAPVRGCGIGNVDTHDAEVRSGQIRVSEQLPAYKKRHKAAFDFVEQQLGHCSGRQGGQVNRSAAVLAGRERSVG